ncbi:unnamed protein product [Brugia timori]|uniref:Transmembrane protein n=1 Tax=Brugia timori TaxID=42155 RepID=A0A0R3R7Z5_9BILA|nr:unnamed protein product [Brugia timori]
MITDLYNHHFKYGIIRLSISQLYCQLQVISIRSVLLDKLMRHSYVPVELMIVTLTILVTRNNCATEITRTPYRIVVKGRMMCGNKGAYAVLLNIFEEVKCKFLISVYLNICFILGSKILSFKKTLQSLFIYTFQVTS